MKIAKGYVIISHYVNLVTGASNNNKIKKKIRLTSVSNPQLSEVVKTDAGSY